MRRKLYGVIALMTILVWQQASAVTLGNMDVKSRYGTPLYAELELFALYDLEHDDIEVRLVPYKEHGYSRTMEDMLEDVQFGIYTSNGIGWVSVTSKTAVKARNLKLVLEVRWPGGHASRYYELSVVGKAPVEQDEGCPFRGRWLKCRD